MMTTLAPATIRPLADAISRSIMDPRRTSTLLHVARTIDSCRECLFINHASSRFSKCMIHALGIVQ